MDEVERRVLSRLRTQLIKEMVVTESFLSAFGRAGQLEEHQTSAIRTETNFEKRASKLLEILPHKSTRAFFTLVDILEITNPWLSEKMRAALHDERTKDAKINIHPSVAKSASIEGFGHSRLHIDTDIKERSGKFVQTNLNHLTEVEQRGVEKWVADELQKERRRQHFRAPHDTRRQRGEFNSCKETQTDTSGMDLREMFNELAIYLHGVDYDEQEDNLSFGLIQEEVKELLGRTKKLDNLFLNCWNKFDDSNKYSMSLPDLIDRTVHHEKRLTATDELNKQMIQKLKDERDSLKRRIRSLEEQLDKFMQRNTNTTGTPQEIQLRHRQNVHVRYTFPYPADCNTMSSDNEANTVQDQGSSEESKPHLINADGDSNSNGRVKERTVSFRYNDESVHNGTNNVTNNNNINNQMGNGQQNNNNNNNNNNNSGTRVNGTGGYIHKAEPVHFEEKRLSICSTHSDDQGTIMHKAVRKTSVVTNGDGDRKVTESRISDTNANSYSNGHIPKIRRHASEESLTVAMSKETSNSVLISRLGTDHQSKKLSVEDLPTAVSQQGRDSPTIKQQVQQSRVSRGDIQSRMQKMLSSNRHVVDAGRQRVSGADTSKSSSSKGDDSEGGKRPNPSAVGRDGSPSGKGNGYQIVYNTKSKDCSGSTGQKGNVNVNSQILHNQYQHQLQPQTQDRHMLFQLVGRYTGSNNDDYSNIKNQQVEKYRNSYRSFSSERSSLRTALPSRPTVPRNTNSSLSLTDSVQRDYTSDSELILKPSSLRAKTARADKSRGRVRFASPIARTTNPNKKSSGRTQRVSHYQMDTTSTQSKKLRVTRL